MTVNVRGPYLCSRAVLPIMIRQRRGSIINTLEALVFFRSMVLDSSNPKSWSHILELADRVMVGVAESYETQSVQTGSGP